MCMQCGMGVDETVKHMLLECKWYANEREVLFEVVSEAVGGMTGMKYVLVWTMECAVCLG